MTNNCCSAYNPNSTSLSFSAGRRRFIRLAALGAGASLFLGKSPAFASGNAEALLLSCMDYRLVDDLARYMDSRGLTNRYDHVILAGASAAVTQEKFKDWHNTFWSHLQAAIDLHKVHRVIIIDHRDCGAYKMAFGAEHAADPDIELAVHSVVLNKLAQSIKIKHASMAVETHLMALDGSVTTIGAGAMANCAPPVKSTSLFKDGENAAVAHTEETHTE